MKKFEEYLDEFDNMFMTSKEIDVSKILNGIYVHNHQGGIINNLFDVKGEHKEEYYKWQFIYAYVKLGLCPTENIGVEISLPKGNAKSADIRMDGVVFDDSTWINHYIDFHNKKDKDTSKWDDLEWLENHMLCIIEFKRKEDEDIKTVYSTQLKGAMQMSMKDIVFGVIYDKYKLYLVKELKNDGDKFCRLAEEFNKYKKNDEKQMLPIQFDDTDSYSSILSLKEMQSFNSKSSPVIDYSKRVLDDLTKVSQSTSSKLDSALNNINVSLDGNGLRIVGYDILVQMLALKIFDETSSKGFLKFYINPDEEKYSKLSDSSIQAFIKRVKDLAIKAKSKYSNILSKNPIDYLNENHVEFLICIVKNFQDYALSRSERSNLYQLVFNKFASHYNKDSDCQFVTPLPLIDFIVEIIQPKTEETIIDPTCGIADFLAVSFLKSNRTIEETNIFGIDIDQSMIDLATLNMLLNDNGNAKLFHKDGLGSIKTKIGYDNRGNLGLIDLIPKEDELNKNNYNGDWENRLDGTTLMKFDCVLTNPPFGKARPFIPKSSEEIGIAECYETYNKYNHNYIDKGIIFTENAVRILEENGRIAIVLSNSLCSVEEYMVLREWLFENLRIVSIIDLPSGTFAEAGIPITVIFGYKPSKKRLEELIKKNYNVFAKKIDKIGYKVVDKTGKKGFEDIPKLNPETFEREINKDGSVKLDEEFTETIIEFREWCKLQEIEIINGFLNDNDGSEEE